MSDARRLTLARESYALIVICMLDLFLTLWLLQTHRATEGNPLMAYYLSIGIGTMVFVKLLLVAMPIFVAEWARTHRPEFVHKALRFAIITYLGVYSLAIIPAVFAF